MSERYSQISSTEIIANLVDSPFVLHRKKEEAIFKSSAVYKFNACCVYCV